MAFALEDYTESCKKRRRVLKSPAHSCRYSAYKVYPKRTPGEHLHKSRTEVRCIPTHKNFRVQMNLAFVDLGHGDRIFMIGGIPISGTVDKKKERAKQDCLLLRSHAAFAYKKISYSQSRSNWPDTWTPSCTFCRRSISW